jgi:peptide deformylase
MVGSAISRNSSFAAGVLEARRYRPSVVRRCFLSFLVMSRQPIVHAGHSALRMRALPVSGVDWSVRQLMDDLIDTMRIPRYGLADTMLGIAANQVGALQRVVAVQIAQGTMALANPEIVERSGSRMSFEGCVSLGLRHVKVVRRSRRVRVRALSRSGRAVDIVAHDKDAAILQHEIDHLDGILLSDRNRKRFYLSYAPWGVA